MVKKKGVVKSRSNLRGLNLIYIAIIIILLREYKCIKVMKIILNLLN